jgi:hypothetical protein
MIQFAPASGESSGCHTRWHRLYRSPAGVNWWFPVLSFLRFQVLLSIASVTTGTVARFNSVRLCDLINSAAAESPHASEFRKS